MMNAIPGVHSDASPAWNPPISLSGMARMALRKAETLVV